MEVSKHRKQAVLAGRSYNTDDIDEANLEAELAALQDDPLLFFAADGESAGTGDRRGLPVTGTNTTLVQMSTRNANV